MKHTKGPWKIRRNQSTNKPSLEVTTKDGRSICFLSKGDVGLSDSHLIAAAPELLEFCERLQEHYQQLLQNDQHLIDELNSVIEKARGES